MNVALAVLIGGAIVAAVAIFLWARSRRRPPAVDPISATTGMNRSLTGRHSATVGSELSMDEALRRLVAYALDDSPRESLSLPPNPEHAPVFQAVQGVLERIEARPEYIPRR